MTKKKTRNNKKTKNIKNIKNKPKKKIVSLSERLQGVYNHVDLSTTQTCKCHCCQVAMPQISYSEFLNIVSSMWDNATRDQKIMYIQTSVEYFFRHHFEKWGISSLIKPCMFLGDDGKCGIYDNRPLSCRLFGILPKEMYEERVDNFEAVYKDYGLSREDLPLNKQCESVKRNNDDVKITTEVVEDLYGKISKLDKDVSDFSDLQVENKENIRTFHDWLLLKVFGEKWLEDMTTYIIAASKEIMELQLEANEEVLRDLFSKGFDVNFEELNGDSNE